MLVSVINALLISLAFFSADGQIVDVCEDSTEVFDIGNGTSKTCDVAVNDPTNCDKEVFQSNCPRSCNTCCRDNPDSFPITNERILRCRRFKHRPELCNDDLFRTNCPASCGICPCRDHTGKFTNKVGRKRSCIYIQDKLVKCRNSMYASNCPATCNTCREYNLVCKIDAELSFPSISEADFYGYHNDFVEVTKQGSDDETCSFEKPSTSWGCTHKGDALIFKPSNPEYYNYLQPESVHIDNAAGSSFKFSVKNHFNSEYEKYYDEDHNLTASLSIKASMNKKRIFKYRANINVKTHTTDEVNPGYKGDLTVTVDCDEKCVCKMSRKIV